MPGLPITCRARGALVLGCLLAAGPAAAQNYPPSTETLMYHLTNDSDVKRILKISYTSAVQAAMLYSKCPTEYRVDDAKKARFNKELAVQDRRLRQAFIAASQKLTGKLPSDAVNKAVDDYIADYQKNKAVEVGLRLQNGKGCYQSTFRHLDEFYEAQYARELQQQAADAAAEEKRRRQAPAVNDEPQETKNH